MAGGSGFRGTGFRGTRLATAGVSYIGMSFLLGDSPERRIVAIGGVSEGASTFRRPRVWALGLSALAIGAPSSFVGTVGRSVLESVWNARDNIDGVSGARGLWGVQVGWVGGSIPVLSVAGSESVPLPGYTSALVLFFGRSEVARAEKGMFIAENMMPVAAGVCPSLQTRVSGDGDDLYDRNGSGSRREASYV